MVGYYFQLYNLYSILLGKSRRWMFGDDVAVLCTVISLTVIWSCVGELLKLKQWVFGC